MCSANEVEFVLFEEDLHDFLTEHVGDPSFVVRPPLHVLVGVRPEQVAEETSVRDVGGAHDASNLLEVAQFWGEASVHA